MSTCVVALLLAATGCAHVATSGDSAATIQLEPYLSAIPSLQVRTNGHPGTFLFDTAGGVTVITPEYAGTIRCTPWSRITGHRMRGDRVDLPRCDDLSVQVEGGSLRIPTAGVFDFSAVLPPNAPPLHGSLALDAFAGQVITLDLGGGRVFVETGGTLTQRTAHATEVPVRFAREAQGLSITPFVAVPTSKGLLWMELDSGSDAPVMIAEHAVPYLEMADVDGARPRVSLSVGGQVKVDADVVVKDLIVDGNIGAPILKGWIVTIDLRHERLWISPRADGAAVSVGSD